jgi:serine/threonine protein kinase/dipeptidyl aminopeptidase/acylaminoacyl peptidase
MSEDRWHQIERIYQDALKITPEKRNAFLGEACRDAPDLKRDVEALLDADSLTFMNRPAWNAVATPADSLLSKGEAVGIYRIETLLGRGGMGEVYRAHDAKLNRDVAVKVLPAAFVNDRERLSRFQREARMLASLNHPNIASIYGLEDSGNALALVMELAEGPTLADRIRQGPVPIDEALAIARQIADALEYAHERSIIHRDLKPANLKVAGDGTVKILDFGLAKALASAPSAEDIANSPTISQMATEAGVLLGTAAYMSPEQGKAKPVDRRADIWAFGCVLYEMLTGKMAFRGDTVTETLAAVLKNEPDWPQLPAATPQHVRVLLRRCLQKDARQRLQAMGDARIALDEVLSGASDANLPATPSVAVDGRRRVLPWALACAAIVAALVLLFTLIATVNAPTPGSGPLVWKQLTFSTDHKAGPIVTDGTRLYFQSQNRLVEMSVNGGPTATRRASIAGMKMIDISPDGSQLLAWKKDFNDETFRGSLWSVPVIEGYPRSLDLIARDAKWSPDGRSMAYTDLNSVYVAGADGRNKRKIWDAPGAVNSLRFSPDSRRIRVTVVEKATGRKIWELKVDGSSPHPLDLPEHAFDGQWTPDGKHFIFVSPRSGQVNVDDLYEVIPPPWFAFWKKPTAVPLTQGQIDVLSATPSRVNEGLFVIERVPQGAMQAYDPAQKTWVPFLGGLAAAEFVISPDKKWMVYVDYPQHHLWRSRLDGSERFQLTDIYSIMPRWSPDNKKIAFSDWTDIYMVSADGGDPEKLIPNPYREVWPAWPPDGKSIAFNDYPESGRPGAIRVLDLATRKISIMPGSEGLYMPTWSPDGKYMVAKGEDPPRLMLYSAQAVTWKTLRTFNGDFRWVWSNDSKFLYLAMRQGPEQAEGTYRLTVPDGAWSQITGYDRLTVVGTAIQGAFPSVTADGQPAIMIDKSIEQIYSANWN